MVNVRTFEGSDTSERLEELSMERALANIADQINIAEEASGEKAFSVSFMDSSVSSMSGSPRRLCVRVMVAFRKEEPV